MQQFVRNFLTAAKQVVSKEYCSKASVSETHLYFVAPAVDVVNPGDANIVKFDALA